MQEVTTIVKRTGEGKGTIVFRIVTAFTLAAIFIPLYIVGILKVVHMMLH